MRGSEVNQSENVSACPLSSPRNTRQTSGSVVSSVPNHQLSPAGYKSCSRRESYQSTKVIEITATQRDLITRFERLRLILGITPQLGDCYDAGFTMEEVDLLELTIDGWLSPPDDYIVIRCKTIQNFEVTT